MSIKLKIKDKFLKSQENVITPVPFNESTWGKRIKSSSNEFWNNKLKLVNKLEYELDIGLNEYQKLVKQHLEQLKATSLERKADLRHDKYLFITINPDKKLIEKNNINPTEFVRDIRQLLNRECITAYQFNIEYYTKNDNHMHSHIIVDRNLKYAPTKIKEKFYKSALRNKYWSKKCNKQLLRTKWFNIQKIGKDYKKDKIEYLNHKRDYKEELQGKDIQWRRNNNISDIYRKYENNEQIFEINF